MLHVLVPPTLNVLLVQTAGSLLIRITLRILLIHIPPYASFAPPTVLGALNYMTIVYLARPDGLFGW